MPGEEPGTAKYAGRFHDTAGSAAIVAREEEGPRTRIEMGRKRMNYGNKHPLAVLDLLKEACGASACDASACDTGGLEFETKIVGKDLHIHYLLQGKALKSHVIG